MEFDFTEKWSLKLQNGVGGELDECLGQVQLQVQRVAAAFEVLQVMNFEMQALSYGAIGAL